MMTIPPLADVKAAAAELREEITLSVIDQFVPRIHRDKVLALADFALAVLNAPGISAERLEEIRSTPDPWVSHAAVPELLTELLRLRAEATEASPRVAVTDTEMRAMPPVEQWPVIATRC